MNHHNVVIACMDFAFIERSMGSVVGEKITAEQQQRALMTTIRGADDEAD